MVLTDWTDRVSVKEIHSGRDGGAEIQDKSRVASSLRRYTRVFRVVTEKVTDESVKVGDLLWTHQSIQLGTAYPEDVVARCRRIRARQESFSKHVWLVTCAYSTEFEVEENPLNDRARITWNTDQYTRVYPKDRNGDAILNAAGEPFDPPIEGDDSRWTVAVQKNLPAVPVWILDYANAINNAPFIIDGVLVGVEHAKMHSLGISEEQIRNDVLFRVLTFAMQFRFGGWRTEILNAGMNQKVDDKLVKCKDRDSHPVTEPVLLTKEGAQMENPSPEKATYIDADLYNLRDFNALPLV